MTPAGRERGAVAILALWAMAIVFALAVAAGFSMRAETAIARNELAAARARTAAEAGVELGLAHLLARRAAGRTLFDGTPETWQDGAIRVAISIGDEAGKIDLNDAPLALLSGLLEAAGQKQETAYLLACRIVAHRGTPAPDCPEPPDAAPEPAALFAATEQVAQLPGFGDGIYQAISCCITVLSGASAIDPAVAPRLALLAVPGATASLVDGWLDARANIMELAPESSGFAGLPDVPYFAISPLRAFTVSAVAVTPEGARARADLAVRLTGQANHPYDIVAFRTPPPGP
jgi:general secretion pathway protein K